MTCKVEASESHSSRWWTGESNSNGRDFLPVPWVKVGDDANLVLLINKKIGEVRRYSPSVKPQDLFVPVVNPR